MTMPLAAFQMSERDLTAAVLQLLDALGWRACHHRPARTSSGWRTPVQGATAAGFPDVLAVKGNRLLVAELKSARGQLAPEQEDWLAALDAVAEVYVWRPVDWTSGRIEDVLRHRLPQPRSQH